MPKITKRRQEQIIDAYLSNGFNQTKAYMAAYPDAKYDSARTNAAKFFANTNIKAIVKQRLDDFTMSGEEALARLTAYASVDLSDFVDHLGYVQLEKLKEAGYGFMYKGTKLSVDKDGGEHLMVELHDPYKALQDILKVQGRFRNYNLDVDLNSLSDEALERIANGEDILKVISSSGPATDSSSGDST